MRRAALFVSLVWLLLPDLAAAVRSRHQTLHSFLQQRYRAEWESFRGNRFEGFVPFFHYAVGYADLNGDDRREAIVHRIHPFTGTGGGGIEIFTPTLRSWRLVGETAIGHMPFRILNTRTRGWRDLGIVVAGGGVDPAYEARLRFNGRTYPYNPSVPPAERLAWNVPGWTVIGRNNRGVPLFRNSRYPARR